MSDLHLVDDILDADIAKEPIRKGFGKGLVTAGKDNENVVAACADLTDSTQMGLFKEAFPERFIEIGVAEQNLVTVGSGLAAKYHLSAATLRLAPGATGNRYERRFVSMIDQLG